MNADTLQSPDLSLIVPTYNEAENIGELISRLSVALSDVTWEVIFVDDNSPDGTADKVREISRRLPHVSCLSRIDRRGLSSACIEGMHMARAPVLAVIDADLQHDETRLPIMLSELAHSGSDIVVGSRYMDGGSTGDWGLFRLLVSRVATTLGRLFVPKNLTDPMSGYFMVRQAVFLETAPHLYGKGFKILLDIFASSPRPLTFKEVPYRFRNRNAGESKLSGNVIWDYLEFLVAKKVSRLLPSDFLLFVLVGGVGVGVHLIALGLLYKTLATPFGLAQLLAIWCAMTSNFFMNNAITYRHSSLKGKRLFYGLLTFYVACAIGAVINFSLAVFLKSFGLHWAIAGASGSVTAAVWNFATTKTFTWRKS